MLQCSESRWTGARHRFVRIGCISTVPDCGNREHPYSDNGNFAKKECRHIGLRLTVKQSSISFMIKTPVKEAFLVRRATARP
jgi:hypothetical protein